MWGTSFTDLARKAQELQDQAAEAASSLSVRKSIHIGSKLTKIYKKAQPRSLFNLDSMQQDESELSASKRTPQVVVEKKEQKPAHSGLGLLSMPIMMSAQASTSPPPRPSGMLKVLVPKEGINKLAIPQSKPPQLEQPAVGEDGWADQEDEIDLDEEDEPIVDTAAKTAPLEKEVHSKEASIRESVVNKESTEESPVTEQHNVVQKTVSEMQPDETTVPEPASIETDESESNKETQEIAIEPASTQQKHPNCIEPTVDIPAAETTNNEPQKFVKRRLVMLISSLPMNRQVQVHQEHAQTALKANGIDFECMDGAAEEHKELRNQLFETSGIRGEYPQFFLVDLSNGGTTFWGTYEKFQHTNDDGKLVEEFGNPDIPKSPLHAPSPPISGDAIPVAVLEHFSHQMKRIEENFQIEREDLERQHDLQLKEQEIQHEAALVAQKEVQDQLRAEIKSKDEQIQELCRRNEGYRLKLDVLKREVAGTQELLEAKGKDAGKTAENHLHELRAMEKKLVAAESEAEKAREECKLLQEALETTRNELATSVEDHNALKERVKEVATELKDRRVECRELKAKIDELMDQNSSLKNSVDSLQERLNHQGASQTEKDDELSVLREKLAAAAKEMEKAQQEWKVVESKHEVTLADYKKKAQHSLSLANARTAAAVQAREEAELDARAARTTADSAFERATKAEIASREAVAEAKATVHAMKAERDRAEKYLDEAKRILQSTEERLATTAAELEKTAADRDSKNSDLEKLRADWHEAFNMARSAEQKLTGSRHEVDLLRREIESLKDQVQLAQAAVSAAESQNVPEKDRPVVQASPSTDSMYQPTEDATVDALQQELQEANEAIEGLKESLKNVLQAKESNGHDASELAPAPLDESNRSASHSTEQPADSVPLFYAMEKQAELKTARSEINRLASVLADVQSEKSAAYEAMDDMRRRMEDAEARLRRFEKLGSAKKNSASNLDRSVENGSGPLSHADGGAVNIEYLKHITFKFLNAKTVAEKKALVPVIGAVLELTSDELSAAMKSVDQSGSMTGAATSFFGFM